MKNFLTYLTIVCGALLFIPSCRDRRGLPSLKESYRMDDKNPFGTYVAFEKMKLVFDNVALVDDGPQSVAGDAEVHEEAGRRSLYFIVADQLYIPDRDLEWMIDYVKKGNELFLSANQFGSAILKKLRIQNNQSVAFADERWGKMKDARVSIYFGEGLPEIPFSFYYFPFKNHLIKYDSTSTRVLGRDSGNQPNLAIFFLGKGRIILHLAPRALSNYFLLTGHNLDYFSHILNYLRPDPVAVYWDDYYNRIEFSENQGKREDDKSFSTLQVIMSHPALRWAFLIAAGTFLFFVFSNMKRRQRIIPVQKKTENTSIDFVKTVGRLYLANRDNKNISHKLISYFYEHIRSRYLLRRDDTKKFAAQLAGKKGMPPQQIDELLHFIREIENSEAVSDEQLLALNNQLENFYNHR